MDAVGWIKTPTGFRLMGVPVRVEVFLPGTHPLDVVTLRQIHSARVIDIDRENHTQGDGLVSSRLPIGVRTADCYPVVYWDPTGRRYAVLHVGWRGLYRGILEVGARLFSGEIHAAIGPGICGRCYVVGESFIDWGREGLYRRDAGLYFHLEGAIIQRLTAIGVSIHYSSPACTLEDPLLPSYRRTGERGRLLLTTVRPHESTGF